MASLKWAEQKAERRQRRDKEIANGELKQQPRNERGFIIVRNGDHEELKFDTKRAYEQAIGNGYHPSPPKKKVRRSKKKGSKK